MGVRFATVAPGVEERRITSNSPAQLAKKRAVAKAAHVAHLHPDALVIGADTVVLLRGKLLPKPKSRSEALDILGRITGSALTAYTAVALVCEEHDIGVAWVEKATVKFREIGEKSALAYVKSGKWRGKAGGFDISGQPVRRWVEKFTGEKETVVGLPEKKLGRVLSHLKGSGHI